MIDENKSVHAKNVELRDQLEASGEANTQLAGEKADLEQQVQGLQGQVSQLTEQLDQATETLREEQLSVGKSNILGDTLRREAMNLDAEGRKLRESWNEKVHALKKSEEDRDHFKAELHQLSEQYKQLVDDLSFCVMDYQVKTSSTQVLNKQGQYELLSTYLNRIYDQQETSNEKYKKLGEISRSRYIETTVPERLIPALVSPNALTRPVEDLPSRDNAVSWVESQRTAVTGPPLSPNGRVLAPTPEGAKPTWNRF
eukprot:TRINITY_DN5848_c0_g1_i2.p1 TRINITY_DN5848_c0_g1~~TRINITY_DN5848_c0_g1_i2.p1  ORF type:complete len:256 (+),score=72.30 TRINITY_DN5848_c0_g1_i2:381-1148(+)